MSPANGRLRSRAWAFQMGRSQMTESGSTATPIIKKNNNKGSIGTLLLVCRNMMWRRPEAVTIYELIMSAKNGVEARGRTSRSRLRAGAFLAAWPLRRKLLRLSMRQVSFPLKGGGAGPA